MKIRNFLFILLLTSGFLSCKKELIDDDEKGWVYSERYGSQVNPMEGPQYVAFLKNNLVKVYMADGGPAVAGRYKIFGNFEAKGSLITIMLDGDKEDIRFVVLSKDEIAREGSILTRSEVSNY